MPYAYVTVDILKGTGALNVTSTAMDERLRQLIEGISQEFDRYTNRRYQPLEGTRYFSGDGSTKVFIPDAVSFASLKEDTNLDGTFETTWAAADYILHPLNAAPTNEYGRPYTYIVVNDKSDGTQDAFLSGKRNYEIVGTWGYQSVTLDTGRKTSASIGSTATAVAIDGTATGAIGIGMTLKVDTEMMYVRNIGSGTGTSITVTRGVNGSTAATHTATSSIVQYLYPQPIVEASIIQAARIWKRRESAYASTIGFPDTGQVMTFRGMDDDIKLMLRPFRRIPIGIGI